MPRPQCFFLLRWALKLIFLKMHDKDKVLGKWLHTRTCTTSTVSCRESQQTFTRKPFNQCFNCKSSLTCTIIQVWTTSARDSRMKNTNHSYLFEQPRLQDYQLFLAFPFWVRNTIKTAGFHQRQCLSRSRSRSRKLSRKWCPKRDGIGVRKIRTTSLTFRMIYSLFQAPRQMGPLN